MSVVIGWIDDLVAGIPIVNQTWSLYKDLTDLIWRNTFAPLLEFIFKLLGIEDQDTISAQVSNTKMFGDADTLESIMTEVALQHEKTQMGIIDLLMLHTARARTSYNGYFNYGKDKYMYGLPSTNIRSSVADPVLIKRAIDQEYSTNTTILESYIRVPIKYEYLGHVLYKKYGYKESDHMMMYLGFERLVAFIDYNYGTDNYDITLTHATEPTIVISEPAYAPDRYYVAKWYTTDSGIWHWWVYKIGTGVYPFLDVANSYITELEMLPVIELRNGTVNVNADKSSAKYLQTKEILNYIGMDPDVLIDTISQNPSIANIEDAYMHFSLDVTKSDPITAKMAYTMFEYLVHDSQIGGEGNYVVTFKEGAYNIGVSWETQHRNIRDGIIGPIGTYTNDIVSETSTDPLTTTDVNGYESTTQITRTVQFLRLRKQETEEQYVEYRIGNLTSLTFVDRGGMVGTVFGQITSGEFLLPMSAYFINQLSNVEQTLVFKKSLYMSIYSAQVTHLEYYETAAFFSMIQIIVIIVAVVITIFTWYTGGATTAAFLAAMQTMAVTMVVMMGLRYILSRIDAPWAKALLIVVAVIAAFMYDPTAAGQIAALTADMVVTAVQQVTAGGYKKLGEETNAFSREANERLKTIKDGMEESQDYLSTIFVSQLARAEEAKKFIDIKVDAFIFSAVQMTYEAPRICIGSYYDRSLDPYSLVYNPQLV